MLSGPSAAQLTVHLILCRAQARHETEIRALLKALACVCAAKGVVTMQKKVSKRPGFASLQESFAGME